MALDDSLDGRPPQAEPPDRPLGAPGGAMSGDKLAELCDAMQDLALKGVLETPEPEHFDSGLNDEETTS